MGNDAVDLTQSNIYQGTLISCNDSSIPKKMKEVIQDGRAFSSARNKPVSEEHLLIILSQDCDLSNSNDHSIEVISIKKVVKKKVDTPKQKNRNYRKLQLPHKGEFWLCEVELISVINKSYFTENGVSILGQLSDYSKGILIDWRVGRYNRIPFPDKFNREFIGEYLKKADNGFEYFLSDFGCEIIDLYIFVDPVNEESADEYTVSITALLNESCSLEDQSLIEKTIKEFCQKVHDLKNSFKMIQIDHSIGPSDLSIPKDFVLRMSDFTFLDASILRRITLDYLCYPDE